MKEAILKKKLRDKLEGYKFEIYLQDHSKCDPEVCGNRLLDDMVRDCMEIFKNYVQ